MVGSYLCARVENSVHGEKETVGEKDLRGQRGEKLRGIDGRVDRQMEEESFPPLFQAIGILFPMVAVAEVGYELV